MLKDNLFLIPPASWSNWISFLFLPFPLMRPQEVLGGSGWRQELAPQPKIPFPSSPAVFCTLNSAHSFSNLFKFISNQCQRSARAVSSVLGFPFIEEFLLLWGCSHCPAPSTNCIVCMECPLLSIQNVHYYLYGISIIVYMNVYYCLYEMSIIVHIKGFFEFFFFEKQYMYMINAWTALKSAPHPQWHC